MKTTHSRNRVTSIDVTILAVIALAAVSVLYGLISIGLWLFELSM